MTQYVYTPPKQATNTHAFDTRTQKSPARIPMSACGRGVRANCRCDGAIVDLNSNQINCPQLDDEKILAKRKAEWEGVVKKNGGTHPSAGIADTRLLNRMRCSTVAATQGAGMHPGGAMFVSEPRKGDSGAFKPTNKYR